MVICLGSGHFHPTESVADKISAICWQQGRILRHVSRGVRWDSDHVILLNDELLNIGRETIRCARSNQVVIPDPDTKEEGYEHLQAIMLANGLVPKEKQ